MFVNHIKNMGWLTSLVFTESGTDYNIAKDFGQFKLEMIETEYQDLELSTSPKRDIKNSNNAASTLGILTEVMNRLNIHLPKKSIIIINQSLWNGC